MSVKKVRLIQYLLLCFVTIFSALNFGNTLAATASEDAVQKSYIAYYARPADPGGLDYWRQRLDDNGGDIGGIINEFGNSEEYTSRFASLNNSQLVNNIYLNLFNREAESAGLQFYVNLLETGQSTLARISLDILNGSIQDDLTVVNNKLDVAHCYSESLRSGGDYDLNNAVSVLSSVSVTSESVAEAKVQFGCVSAATNYSIKITVDPTIPLTVSTLPGFDGRDRPLGVLKSDDGEEATFVTNELWLSTDDQNEVDQIIDSWNGMIIKEIDFSDVGADVPKQYLIRIDTSLADATKLSGSVKQLIPEGVDYEGTISSQQGLELLAANVEEAITGKAIGINWVGKGNGYIDGYTHEAPTGGSLGGIGYSPSTSLWPTHKIGGVQNIGVTRAWEYMALAGKLSNRIGIAILDHGFFRNDDLNDSYHAISNIPFRSPFDRNFLGCAGGGSCPWHGGLVASAAMAIPDNDFGSAGPAGPVAIPTYMATPGDMFTTITAIRDVSQPQNGNNTIINMSYSVPVPWWLSSSVIPSDVVTFGMRKIGYLMFAAAGNSNTNVDAQARQCVGAFGVCATHITLPFEASWVTPCENAGVICVGGIDVDSFYKAPKSSYGNKQVDIFAPYELWLGPDPDNPDNVTRGKSGTSYSSPFVAGVAGLIWAANPQLSANRVEDILMDTAHSSQDSRVRRIVNAAGAVKEALGNIPPNITLSLSSGEYQVGLSYQLRSEVHDFEDGRNCCEVIWSSNREGELGTGAVLDATFTQLGNHTLTIRATDSQGGSSQVTATINVVNTRPTVEITTPSNGAMVFKDSLVNLRGSAADINEPGRFVACSRLEWTVSNNASSDFPANGCEPSVSFSNLGEHTLTLTATDSHGSTDSESIVVNVQEPPPNLPPNVNITSPVNQQDYDTDEELSLVATVSDPEGDTNLTFVWSVQDGSSASQVIGEGNNITWRPSDTIDFSGEGGYSLAITLSVTDSAGNVGTDTVSLRDIFIIN